MTDLTAALVDFLASHAHLAYFTVLLMALLESLPFVGIVVPGTGVIVALSALVPGGALRMAPLMAAAFLGALLGDGVSFLLGYRYKRKILGFAPFVRYPELVRRSEDFFARHGDKGVFLARFTPGVRAFVPIFAGILGMPLVRFYTANALSALLWAPAHVLAGVLAGAAFSHFGAAAKPLAALLVAFLACLWVVRVLVRRILRWGASFAERLRTTPEVREAKLGRAVLALIDPKRSQPRYLALSIVLLVGAAWLFFAILESVASGDPLVFVDRAVWQLLQGVRTLPGDSFMIAVTELGDTAVSVAVSAAVLLWLLSRRAWRTAGHWVVALAGASALNSAIKVALHRARPNGLLYSGWSAFSFPSGHSTVNMVLYGFLAFLVAREVRPSLRLPVALGATTLIFFIAFSRLYLGAHWFSDVVGSLTFGTAWITLLGLSYVRRPGERIDSRGLLAVVCATFLIAGGIYIHRNHAADVERYAVRREMSTMVAADWWSTGWEGLPIWRVDVTGERGEPLTFQWAGSAKELREILSQKGWRAPAPWTVTNALLWLTPGARPSSLPVVTLLAYGRLPGLVLARYPDAADADTRFVLRLWPADIELTGDRNVPLWIGSVVRERACSPLPFFTRTVTEPNFDVPLRILLGDLEGGRLVLRMETALRAGWKGEVLLARTLIYRKQ